jgi:ATP-dependent DNA ligase
LLAECVRLDLEGIVAKRRDSPYRSGTRSGWIKVKTPEWKAANHWRATLFEKPTRG